jgi:hypothetical protein
LDAEKLKEALLALAGSPQRKLQGW